MPLVKRIVRDIVDKYQELVSLREIAEAKKRQNLPERRPPCGRSRTRRHLTRWSRS